MAGNGSKPLGPASGAGDAFGFAQKRAREIQVKMRSTSSRLTSSRRRS
jgi:hypothetical protein